MSNIYIICEGQTEQLFVRDVLAPYFLTVKNECYLTSVLIGTSNHKGGDVRFSRFVNNVKNFRNVDCYISSLLDFFRIDSNWPGIAKIKLQKKNGCTLRKEDILKILNEKTLEKVCSECNINPTKFISNFVMHEFEALLFSDVEKLTNNISINGSRTNFSEILNNYNNDPELINMITAPSRIILNEKKNYKKTVDGLSIAKDIGIDKMRQECSCFNTWIEQLIALE